MPTSSRRRRRRSHSRRRRTRRRSNRRSKRRAFDCADLRGEIKAIMHKAFEMRGCQDSLEQIRMLGRILANIP